MVTSSVNEISMDQLGNKALLRGRGGVTPPLPLLSGQIFKDDVNRFLPSRIFASCYGSIFQDPTTVQE